MSTRAQVHMPPTPAVSLAPQVQGFMKTALQGDRTLPSNAVVAKLKALVTEFKATLPVVVNLRCPALRRRHWAAIHQAVGYEIKVRSTCLFPVLVLGAHVLECGLHVAVPERALVLDTSCGPRSIAQCTAFAKPVLVAVCVRGVCVGWECRVWRVSPWGSWWIGMSWSTRRPLRRWRPRQCRRGSWRSRCRRCCALCARVVFVFFPCFVFRMRCSLCRLE